MHSRARRFLLFFAFSFSAAALAAPGDPDSAFGSGGKMHLDDSSTPQEGISLAVQSDGKYIVATTASGFGINSTALLRFTMPTAVDSTYGYQGSAITPYPAQTHVRISGTNALVAINLGMTAFAQGPTQVQYGDVRIARYDATGRLDTTFGSQGLTPTFNATSGSSTQGLQQLDSLAVGADGKIVAVGYASASSGTNRHLLVVRFTSSGALDTSFGTGGWFAFDTTLGASVQELQDVAVNADGSIVAAGYAGPTHNGIVVSVNAVGTTAQLLFTHVANSQCQSIAPASSRFLVGCGGSPTLSARAYLFALTSAGTVDNTFAASTTSAVYSWRSVAVAGDGTVYAIGNGATSSSLTINAFLSNGTPNTAFANAGQYVASDTPSTGAALAIDGSSLVYTGGRSTQSQVIVGSLSLPGGGAPSIAYPRATSMTFMGRVASTSAGIIAAGVSGIAGIGNYVVARVGSTGALDTTFGNGGFSTLAIPNLASGTGARGLAVQPDGKVLVTGDFGGLNTNQLQLGVARLGPTGADASFNASGTPGYSALFTGSGVGWGRGVKLLPDGHILVVGSAVSNHVRQTAIARFNADGTLDTTFGSSGLALSAFSSSTSGRNMDVAPDGRILAVGSQADVRVARFSASGSLDSTFGTGGMVSFAMPTGYNLFLPSQIFATSNGKIVVVAAVGSSNASSPGAGFMTIRFNGDGSLDTSYGANGGWTYLQTVAGSSASTLPWDAAVASNGKLVIVGESDGTSTMSTIVRFNADGSPDASFGTNGALSYLEDALSGSYDQLLGIALAPDGSLLVAGANVSTAYQVGLLLKTVADPTATGLLATPPSINSGTQSINTTSLPTTVTLSNEGTDTLGIGSIASTGPFGVTNNCGASLAPRSSCVATITFSPTQEGAAAGTLTVSTTDGGVTNTQSLALSGNGERSLVSQFYESILGRLPDSGGSSFWNSEAQRITSQGGSINEVWFAMAMSFFASPEYVALNRNDAGFVTDLYKAFFSRAPDASGLAYWTGLLASGMPREVLLATFMFSPEFVSFTQSIFGTTTVRPEITMVMDFYRGALARLPDTAGLAYWVQQFRTAQCQGSAAVNSEAATLAGLFFDSAEYAGRNRTNAQFVGDLFNAILRRGGDAGGVSYWLSQLGSGAMTRDQVMAAFLASPEFGSRVTAIVSAGCLAP